MPPVSTRATYRVVWLDGAISGLTRWTAQFQCAPQRAYFAKLNVSSHNQSEKLLRQPRSIQTGTPNLMAESMTSSVPYLIRAIHEWVSDNGQTPYLVADATHQRCDVPLEHVKDGQIVLNVSHSAVRDLNMTNDYIMFSARFSGVARNICVPTEAVLGVMARESGEGMWFPRQEAIIETDPNPMDHTDSSSPDDEPPPPTPPKRGAPSLKVVK